MAVTSHGYVAPSAGSVGGLGGVGAEQPAHGLGPAGHAVGAALDQDADRAGAAGPVDLDGGRDDLAVHHGLGDGLGLCGRVDGRR